MTTLQAKVECPPNCKACELRDRPAFVRVSDAALEAIQHARSHALQVPAGSTLIYEGQRNAQLFTVYSGWAFRYKTLPDGRRQILNFLLPGDLTGLQQVFGGDAACGVELLTDCALCVFKDNSLMQLYSVQPRLGYDVTWLAAREGQHVDDNLLTAGQRNALERVAMLLLHLYRRMDRIGQAESGSIVFPLTQQHIADSLGLSLVHTNKTLRRLAQMGLHKVQAGRLHLLNPRALSSVAEYYDTPPRLLPLL